MHHSDLKYNHEAALANRLAAHVLGITYKFCSFSFSHSFVNQGTREESTVWCGFLKVLSAHKNCLCVC